MCTVSVDGSSSLNAPHTSESSVSFLTAAFLCVQRQASKSNSRSESETDAPFFATVLAAVFTVTLPKLTTQSLSEKPYVRLISALTLDNSSCIE